MIIMLIIIYPSLSLYFSPYYNYILQFHHSQFSSPCIPFAFPAITRSFPFQCGMMMFSFCVTSTLPWQLRIDSTGAGVFHILLLSLLFSLSPVFYNLTLSYSYYLFSLVFINYPHKSSVAGFF
uniref:Uncharacterized protein n=1 Tax=Cacopsylla melanoneura TaxID=428564 RepID=A0A8D8TLF7_9HEMI